jgi:hypothetical protein
MVSSQRVRHRLSAAERRNGGAIGLHRHLHTLANGCGNRRIDFWLADFFGYAPSFPREKPMARSV